VLNCQLLCIENCKPNMTFENIHNLSKEFFINELNKLEIPKEVNFIK
jgi:hypothetical protein